MGKHGFRPTVAAWFELFLVAAPVGGYSELKPVLPRYRHSRLKAVLLTLATGFQSPDHHSEEKRVEQLQLTDFDLDQQLLSLPGVSLLIFTSLGCSSCRWARHHLPGQSLPLDRLCWIDAEENGGAVQRYGVFHLPAMFVVRDGAFFGPLRTQMSAEAIAPGLEHALATPPDELP
jgi:hypothetical protein